jgi:hypothetical protein
MSIPTLTEEHFEKLCADKTVRKHLRLITPDHLSGIGCYLLGLPVWLLFAVYGGYALDRAGLYPGPWVFFTLLVLAVVVPLLPILRARRHMHRPVLDTLATLNGMDYASHDFEMKAYAIAKPRLFGEEASESFTDLLAGKDGKDAFAICHAEIELGGEPAYQGLFYWLKRKSESTAFVAAVPLSVAPRLKLSDKAKRLPGLDDGEFDAVFAVFTDRPDEAPAMLHRALRQMLLGHAVHGPVYLHIGHANVFLAACPPDSFEAPLGTARADRLRAIFLKVVMALDVAKAVRDAV